VITQLFQMQEGSSRSWFHYGACFLLICLLSLFKIIFKWKCQKQEVTYYLPDYKYGNRCVKTHVVLLSHNIFLTEKSKNLSQIQLECLNFVKHTKNMLKTLKTIKEIYWQFLINTSTIYFLRLALMNLSTHYKKSSLTKKHKYKN